MVDVVRNALTYASLRTGLAAGTYVAGQSAFIQGRAANNDGGEGEFQILPIGSYVDNGGTILTNGSFAAVRSGPIRSSQFESLEDAIAAVPESETLWIDGPTTVSSPISFSGKRITIDGGNNVITKAFSTPDPVITASGAGVSGSVIKNIRFVGVDDETTYAAALAGMATNATGLYRRGAVRVSNASDCVVANISTTGFIVAVNADACTDCVFESIYLDGFGAEIAALPEAANSHPTVNALQGARNRFVNIVGRNCGAAIIVGQYSPADASNAIPEDYEIESPKAFDAYDTAIYLSSAERTTISNPLVVDCTSGGIKIQGSNTRVIGGMLKNCATGIVVGTIATTADFESTWGGRGTTIVGTTIIDASGRGIHLYIKSGSSSYTYRNIISGVNIQGGCTAAGISGTAEHTEITGVMITEMTGNGINLTGAGNSAIQEGLSITNVRIENTTGTGMVLSGVSKAAVHNIKFREAEDTSSRFIRLLSVDNSEFSFIRSSTGKLTEEATCDANLFVEVNSPVTATLSGTNRRSLVTL